MPLTLLRKVAACPPNDVRLSVRLANSVSAYPQHANQMWYIAPERVFLFVALVIAIVVILLLLGTSIHFGASSG